MNSESEEVFADVLFESWLFRSKRTADGVSHYCCNGELLIPWTEMTAADVIFAASLMDSKEDDE